MRIMFCVGAMAQGGAERVVANLSNELSDGNEVSIVSTICGDSFYALDKRVRFFTLDSDCLRRNVVYRTIRRIRRLRHLLLEEKPDVAIAFLPEPTFRLLIAKRFLGIKTIVSVRNNPKVLYNTFFKKLIVKMIYPVADGFVFQTEDAKKWFPKKIQLKSVVIPNPINKQFVCKPYKGIRDKNIVCVARLVKQKNHKMLIDAFRVIAKNYPDYSLILLGDGPCRDSLEKRVTDYGLQSRVHFLGEVSNVRDMIYKASIFVLPSDYEGMPNALMEAMALGLPCISTDSPIGGARYLIKNKVNGVLIDVGDEIGLINSMSYIIENEEFAKKIGVNANKICSRLSPEKIVLQWKKYISEVVYEERK